MKCLRVTTQLLTCLVCRELLVDRELAAKQSSCELEVDIVAADILNRLEVGGKVILNSTYRSTKVS